jgi:acetyl-CoA acetyltransferase family protein
MTAERGNNLIQQYNITVGTSRNLYIVEGRRTPFCRMGTLLSQESAASLGISATKSTLAETGISPSLIDEVIFGCVGQPAKEMNVARVIGVRSGIPESTPAVTIHRNCASGMEAVTYAHAKALAGKGDIFLAGGTENMSQMPLLYKKSASEKFARLLRSKSVSQKIKTLLQFRPSDFLPRVSLRMGLEDPLSGLNMGETAELLSREFSISRKEQDFFAFLSHEKAILAEPKLAEEIAPIYTNNNNCVGSPDGRFVERDNGPRKDCTTQKLSTLSAIFDKKEGTVTAGNASQITDGAVSILLMTEKGLEKTGCSPIARIVDYAYSGCNPNRMGLGPYFAIGKLGINVKSMDLIEINEAFAGQVLACKKLIEQKHVKIPDEKLNVNGGSIALGHPVGASGARLILTLAKELKRRGLTRGVASLCVGGGQGSAMHIEVCK